MSAWILALRDLHRFGGVAGISLLGDNHTRTELRRHGLAAPLRHVPGGPEAQLRAMARKASDRERIWAITERGRDLVEGRLEIRRGPHNVVTFVATWLAALPQAHIDPPPPRPPVERGPLVSPPKTAARRAAGNASHPWRRGIAS